MTADVNNENEFTHEGVVYVAVGRIGWDSPIDSICDQCAFGAAGCSPASAPPCGEASRSDEREIIWKIKPETTGQPQ